MIVANPNVRSKAGDAERGVPLPEIELGKLKLTWSNKRSKAAAGKGS